MQNPNLFITENQKTQNETRIKLKNGLRPKEPKPLNTTRNPRPERSAGGAKSLLSFFAIKNFTETTSKIRMVFYGSIILRFIS